jgi:hypothetical protein
MVVWNTENWRPTTEIVAHTAAILSYHIFDDSKFILALSEDQTCSVRYWQRFLVQFLAKSQADCFKKMTIVNRREKDNSLKDLWIFMDRNSHSPFLCGKCDIRQIPFFLSTIFLYQF